MCGVFGMSVGFWEGKRVDGDGDGDGKETGMRMGL